MRHTIRDVAAAAGVSTATVSRVLAPDNPDTVSEKTRLRVFSAVQKLGYRTNHTARSLKTRSTKTVGIVVPELANDFFIDLIEGIEKEFDKQGYTLFLSISSNSVEEEKKRLAMFLDRMVDGIVVVPAGAEGGHLEALADTLPVVLMDRLPEDAGLDAVVSDNEGGAFELTRALLEDGFRRVAFAGGDMGLSSARERLAGFKRALAEAGIDPDPELLCLGGMGMEDGFRRMEHILGLRELPEAVVTVNLMVHLGIERRLLDYTGTRPVIAGFDSSMYTPFFPCRRYSATQDAEGISRETARRILERIEQKKNECFDGYRITRFPVCIIRH